jgi:hypothetical protein
MATHLHLEGRHGSRASVVRSIVLGGTFSLTSTGSRSIVFCVIWPLVRLWSFGVSGSGSFGGCGGGVQPDRIEGRDLLAQDRQSGSIPARDHHIGFDANELAALKLADRAFVNDVPGGLLARGLEQLVGLGRRSAGGDLSVLFVSKVVEAALAAKWVWRSNAI